MRQALRTHKAMVVLLMSLGITTGCASFNKTPVSMEQEQRAALERWQACIDRAMAAKEPTLSVSSSDAVIDHCEGHHRDVLLSFPENLETQLDGLLKKRAHEHVLRSAALQVAR